MSKNKNTDAGSARAKWLVYPPAAYLLLLLFSLLPLAIRNPDGIFKLISSASIYLVVIQALPTLLIGTVVSKVVPEDVFLIAASVGTLILLGGLGWIAAKEVGFRRRLLRFILLDGVVLAVTIGVIFIVRPAGSIFQISSWLGH